LPAIIDYLDGLAVPSGVVGMLDQAQLNRIQDPETRRVVQQLANLLEQALDNTDALRAENQRLKDEINRLKGEQGKPTNKPNKPKPASTDHSSEQERKKPTPWKKGTKNDKIVTDRTEVVPGDRESLPADAVFKEYESVLIQNLKLVTDNIRFARARYYSPSTGKTYLAPLPQGYAGGFGPDLKALALSLHHLGNVSQPALHTLFTQAGIHISTGQISNILTQGQEMFHQEKREIGLAGLASSVWQQTDDTLTRVDGENQHCHVVTNPLYTTYTTLPKKDRLSVLDALRNGAPRTFLLTPEVLASPVVSKFSGRQQRLLAGFSQETVWDEASLLELLEQKLPTLSLQNRKGLLEAMALAAYHAQTAIPIVSLLVCDDAPQFVGLTEDLSLCWIHDARHYQKLSPHLPCFDTVLTDFKKRYWEYYNRLLAYREHPTAEERATLFADFDVLFVPNTGYAHLDFRIQQTCANKVNLLQVLPHPEIPLHNNASELAVRRRVRKRDVSFGPRSPAGVAVWDTFQTIAATAQKLSVSFIAYVTDRVSGRNEMPSLASLITERAREMNLNVSWK
jgi:hypothetical protein